MNKQRYEKFFLLLAILIAILNIGLIVKLFLHDIVDEIFTFRGIIAIALQICIIIISTIIIKKGSNNKKKNLLIILLIVFLIITFFIPIQMNYHLPHSTAGLTPSVLPRRVLR